MSPALLKFAEILHIAAFSMCLLLIGYLLKNRRQPGNHYYLIAMGFMTLLMVQGYLYLLQYIFYVPSIALFGYPIMGAFGPLYYLGLRARLGGRSDFQARDLLFFIVPLLEILQILPYLFSGAGEQIQYIKDDFQSVHLDAYLRSLSSLFNNAVFALMGLHFIRKLKGQKPAPPEIREQSLLSYFALMAFLILFALLLYDPKLFNTGMSGSVWCFLFLIFAYVTAIQARTLVARTLEVRAGYEKSLLPQSELQEYGGRLDSYLRRERPYVDADFKLKQAAEYMQLSTNLTSQVVNRWFDCSFTELMNQHRIQYGQELLTDTQFSEMTILRVSLECGFNSISRFNTLFKKQTGLTPGQWRAQNS